MDPVPECSTTHLSSSVFAIEERVDDKRVLLLRYSSLLLLLFMRSSLLLIAMLVCRPIVHSKFVESFCFVFSHSLSRINRHFGARVRI